MKHKWIFGSLFCLLAQAQTTPMLNQAVISRLTELVVANHGTPQAIQKIVDSARPDGTNLKSTAFQLCHGVPHPPPVVCGLLRQYALPQSYTLYQSFTMLYNLTAPKPSPIRTMMSMAEQALYKHQHKASSQICDGIVTVNATINDVPYQLEFNLSDPKKTLSVTTGSVTHTFKFTSSVEASITDTLTPTDLAPVKLIGPGWAGTVTFSSAQTCGQSAQIGVTGTGRNPNCAVGEVDSPGRSVTVNMTNSQCAEGTGAGIGPGLVSAWIDTILELGGTVLNGLSANKGDEIPPPVIDGMVAFTPLGEPTSYRLNSTTGAGSRANPY